ncbi:MAG: PhzF family phenazine biosynthesis protein, partial [Acidobacteriota bacterium]|nr:PhzF family phenazine biosynthesis protein [Acidobacteriota bacterium]
MQTIAREMNLSETVFVLPPTDSNKALRRLRIFTPGIELPMAGHPVVGTWAVLAQLGVVAPPDSGDGVVTIHQELKVGILPVAIEFARGEPIKVVMTQPPPQISKPVNITETVARALSLPEDKIGFDQLPIVVATAGVPYLMVPLHSRDALSSVVINSSALSDLLKQTGVSGVYAFTAEPHSPQALVSARMFSDAALGISEDPATGSAAGPLAATLVHSGFVPAVGSVARFTIEQGVDMDRPSYIEAEVEGERGDVRVVRIGGTAVTVAKGEIFW